MNCLFNKNPSYIEVSRPLSMSDGHPIANVFNEHDKSVVDLVKTQITFSSAFDVVVLSLNDGNVNIFYLHYLHFHYASVTTRAPIEEESVKYFSSH